MKNQGYKLKNDRFRKSKGGVSRVFDIFCSQCDNWILTYQKDGIGRLRRCYFDRILAPRELVSTLKTHLDPGERQPHLFCTECGSLVGTHQKHLSGRDAFRLQLGATRKTRLE